MPYLQLEERRIPLQQGENRVGGGESGGGESAVVVVSVDGGQGATLRVLSAGDRVEVNGVSVGAQPALLFHGDRLRIEGTEYLFCDDGQTGPTLRVEAAEEPEPPTPPTHPGPRARSNGRVVSLVDGREYAVHGDGLWIGRDAGCDVVVSSRDVSRRHARIELEPDGYVLRDVSMNGVRVNGVRINEVHPLAIGDVIRVGPEELRFHGTAAEGEETPPMLPVILPPRPVATPPRPVTSVAPAPATPVVSAPPAEVPDASVVRTAAIPSATPPVEPVARPVLATLEILNPGPSKGTRFSIDTPLLHLGRGAHNDIRLSEESVSDLHAKLQRRADGWHVIDLGSTNGTYVAGQRIRAESRIASGGELRLGGVKLRFLEGEGAGQAGGDTRVVAAFQPSTGREQGTIIPSGMPASPVEGGGLRRALVAALVVLALLAVFLFVRMQ